MENSENESSTTIGYPVQLPRNQYNNVYVPVETEEEDINKDNDNNPCPAGTLMDDGPITKNEICFTLLGALFVVAMWLLCNAITPSNTVEPPIVFVDSISFKTSNLSTLDNVTSDWKLELLALNGDDKTTIFFDVVEISILYKGKVIASNQTKSFNLGTTDAPSIVTSFSSSPSLHVEWNKTAVVDEWIKKKTLSLDVELHALVKLNNGADNETYGWVYAECNNVKATVYFNETKLVTGGSKWCSRSYVHAYEHHRDDSVEENQYSFR